MHGLQSTVVMLHFTVSCLSSVINPLIPTFSLIVTKMSLPNQRHTGLTHHFHFFNIWALALSTERQCPNVKKIKIVG